MLIVLVVSLIPRVIITTLVCLCITALLILPGQKSNVSLFCTTGQPGEAGYVFYFVILETIIVRVNVLFRCMGAVQETEHAI